MRALIQTTHGIKVIISHVSLNIGSSNLRYVVCYQTKIENDDGDFILGVDRQLGNAMVVFAVLVLIMYGYTLLFCRLDLLT